MNKKRADLILVEKKIANSRTQAQDLIKSGINGDKLFKKI